MKILILEDEQRNAMRLIRLLNDIDTTFIIEGPLTNIKEAVDLIESAKIRLYFHKLPSKLR